MRSVEVRTIATEGTWVPAVVIRYLASRMALFGALSALFAVIGGFMLFDADLGTKALGAFALLFFGGGTIVMLAQIRHPAYVGLTRDGIVATSRFGHAFTPWAAVVGVRRARIGRNEMIVIDVDDPDSIRTSAALGWLKRLNSRAGFPDLAFPTNVLGNGSEVLEAGVRRYATEPNRRPAIGTSAELTSLLDESGVGSRREEPSQASPASDARHDASRPPWVARGLLYGVGVVGVAGSGLALLASGDPERTGSRLLGAALIGAMAVAALAAAWLLRLRPRAARLLGVATAAVGLFVGSATLGSERPGALNDVIGAALVVAALVIAWQLVRWRPTRRASGPQPSLNAERT